MKSLWRGVFFKGMWSEVLHGKYIKGDILNCIRNQIKNRRNVSNFLFGFLKAYAWMCEGLCWKVGRGTNILVGIDPVIRVEENYLLSPFILDHLLGPSYITLDQNKHPSWIHHSNNYWLSSKNIGLGSIWDKDG